MAEASVLTNPRWSGDGAVDAFIEEHYRRLVGLMLYRTGDRAVAEDLAQDALIKLIENWESVSTMTQPWSWLARVAINLSNSRYRRLKVAERIDGVLKRQTQQAVEPNAEEAVALVETVKTLPKRQCQALLLRHYIGLSVNETAEAMGCSPGTVKGLTHTALANLRERLNEDVDPVDLLPHLALAQESIA